MNDSWLIMVPFQYNPWKHHLSYILGKLNDPDDRDRIIKEVAGLNNNYVEDGTSFETS